MDVLAKAARLGVETSFVDATGARREIDSPALKIIIDSIPDASGHPLLPSALLVRGDAYVETVIADEAKLPLNWQVFDQGNQPVAGGVLNEHRWPLPRLAHGVYRLRAVDADGRADERPLLTVPQAAFGGEFDRIWLLAVQLYGVRSSRNWGIGDFTDLEALLTWASQAGAAGVGLNPLHALFDDHPGDCSPYSPSSRLFLNPLYIDVARLPELPEDFARAHAQAIESSRSAPLVDYNTVAALKSVALHAAFERFQHGADGARRARFNEFRAERGRLLFRFACFEILRRRFSGPWWDWPEPWRDGSDEALDQLRDTDAAELAFVEFVQWCAHEQLKACSDLAQTLKLPVGLYLDIAVGVKADGFDAWNEQIAISRRLSVGAPPDLLNTAGQDWGLAGFSASGLEETLYEPFRQMLRASMRYGGAVRLDHVLGLNRLYVIPSGSGPGQGAYLRMPLEILLGVIALESVAHHCVVIGEDLGTVPDGLRERLADWNLWSYRVMIFERTHDGGFQRAEDYPQNALVTFNTHDLPTFAAWVGGHDIELKHGLGIDPGETRDSRAHAVHMLGEALRNAGLHDTTFHSALRYLARTRSRILAVGIEDLLGVVDQTNVPGTINQHPNWRRRLPVSLENWNEHIDVAALQTVLTRD